MTAIEKPVSRIRLTAKAFVSILLGFICVGLLVFLLAGSLAYWNVWLLLLASAINTSCELIYLVRKDPEKLAKRLRWQEKRKSQKSVLWITLTLELAAFVLPGLDYRFGWSSVPIWLVMAALPVFECGFIFYYTSLNYNQFASRVIELQDKHTVIATGPNAIVRHPMYASIMLVILSIPFLLGSFYMLIPMALLGLEFVVRIRDEEQMLIESLDGYWEYMKKVKYRLIPFIW
jgi:protein-S-isoprenylcysteine O-methyltransferase Ste14